MNIAAGAVVGAVAGWVAGIVLTGLIRWLGMTLFDAEITLRGLEFVGVIAGVALAVVLGRKSNRSDDETAGPDR